MTDRRVLLAGLLFVGVFATGVVFGFFLSRATSEGPFRGGPPHGPRRGPPGPPPPAELAARLRAQLQLTDEQTRAIEAAIRDGQTEHQRIFEETRPRLESAMERSRTSIRTLLTDEQRTRFDELDHPGDHPPPGPPGFAPPPRGPGFGPPPPREPPPR